MIQKTKNKGIFSLYNRKKIVSAALCLLFFFFCGNIWGENYTFTGAGGDAKWSTPTNWTPNGTPGAGDTVSIPGNTLSSQKVILDRNYTIGTLTVGNGTGTPQTKVEIDTQSYTLTSSNFIIVDKENGNEKSPVSDFLISGNGSITANGFDFPNISSDTATYTITIDTNSKFYITGSYYADSATTITTKFTGNGQLYIPKCGADVNWGKCRIKYELTKEILTTGTADYYKITKSGEDSFSTENPIKLTIYRPNHGTETVSYPYTAKIFSASGTNFTIGGVALQNKGSVTIGSSKTSLEYEIRTSQAPQSGDGFSIKFYAPDGSGILLGTVEYNYKDMIWSGDVSSDWNTAGNWYSGTVPQENDSITIPNLRSRYPVLEDNITVGGDLLVEQGANINANGHKFTVNGETELSGNITQFKELNFAGKVTINSSATISSTITDSELKFENDVEYAATELSLTAGKVSFGKSDYYGKQISGNITSLTVNGKADIYSDMSNIINQKYTDDVTVYGNGNYQLNNRGGNGSVIFGGKFSSKDISTSNPIPVTFGNTYTVEFNDEVSSITELKVYGKTIATAASKFICTQNADFEGGFAAKDTVNSYLKLFCPATIKSTNSFTALNIDSSSYGTMTIQFEAGKTQTVSQISVSGSSGKEISLVSTAENQKWKVNFASPLPTTSNFSYTKIKDSESTQFLAIYVNPEYVTDANLPAGLSTTNWFITKFLWYGSTNSDWKTKENWKYDENGVEKTVPKFPDYETGYSEIVVKSNPSNFLNLPDTTKLAELEIEQDSDIHLLGYGLTVSKKFTNNGSVHLYGTQINQDATSSINLPAGQTTENGKWIFFDDNTGASYAGNGYLTSIANHTFKIVEIAGNGYLTAPSSGDSFSATTLYLKKNSATGMGNTIKAERTLRINTDSIISDTDTETTIFDIKATSDFGIGKISGYSSDTISGTGNLVFSGGNEVNLRMNINLTGNLTAQDFSRFAFYNSLCKATNIFISGKTDTSTVQIESITTATEINADSANAGEITFGDGHNLTINGSKALSTQGKVNLKSHLIVNTSFSLSGDTVFDCDTNELNFIKPISFNSNSLEINSQCVSAIPLTFGTAANQAFSDNAKLTLYENAQIYGNNNYAALIIDTSKYLKSINIQFENEKTQTFANLDCNGSENIEILLSAINSDYSKKWLANLSGAAKNFLYTKVDNSASVDNFGLPHKLYIVSNPLKIADAKTGGILTTTDWFIYGFIWKGTTDTKWTTASNWIHADGAAISESPSFSDGLSEITIENALYTTASPFIPQLADDPAITTGIKVKTLVVASGAAFNLNGKNITAETLKNDGLIKLEGNQTASISNPLIFDDLSVIEYTGNVTSSLALGNSYKNLTFANGSSKNFTENITAEKNFISSGSLSQSSGTLTLLSNADFNGDDSGNFSSTGGNIHYYNTNTTQTEFKTAKNMVVNDFHFAGNERITLNGTVTANSLHQTANSYGQTENFTVTFTGNDDGSLKVKGNAILDNASLPPATVIGTTIFEKPFSCAGNFEAKENTVVEISSTFTGTQVSAETFIIDENSEATADKYTITKNLTASGRISASEVNFTGNLAQGNTIESSAGNTFEKIIVSNAPDTILTSNSDLHIKNLEIISGKFSAGDSARSFPIYIYNSWTDKNGNFISNDSTVFVKGEHSDTITFCGNSQFYKFTADQLGGKKLVFASNDADSSGKSQFRVTNELLLRGSGADNFLEISGSGEKTEITAAINLDYSQANGKHLSISGVSIGNAGDDWDGRTIPPDAKTYTTFTSIPNSGYVPFGWIIEMKYFWTGRISEDWNTPENWSYIDDSNFVQSTITVPNFWAEVIVAKEYSGIYSDRNPHFVQNSPNKVEVRTFEMRENMALFMQGTDFTVGQIFTNSGNVHLYGTETVTLPENSTENGIWSFSGGADSAGTIKPTGNIDYKTLVAEGNAKIQSVHAQKFEIGPSFAGAEKIVLTIANDYVLIDAPVILKTNCDFIENSFTVEFKNTITENKILTFSGNGNKIFTEAVATPEIMLKNLVINSTGTTVFTKNVYAESSSVAGNTTFKDTADKIEVLTSSEFKNDVYLNADFTFKGISLIFGNANSVKITADEKNIVFSGDFIPKGNVAIENTTSQTAQKGKILLDKVHGTDSNNLSIKSYEIQLNSGDYITGGEQIFTATIVKMIKTNSGIWRAGGKGVSVSGGNLFLDFDSERLSLESNLLAGNIYFYSGKLSVQNVELCSEKDFAIWGAKYNEDDPRFPEMDSRFSFPGSYSSLYERTSNNAVFENLSQTTLKVISGGFYANGTDFESQSLSLVLPSNTESKVNFNSTAAFIPGQWGETNFAVIFNSKIANTTVSCTNPEKEVFVAAAAEKDETEYFMQGVIDKGGNKGITFTVPKIIAAHSVYDDVIFVRFDMMLENSNGEINTNLTQKGTSVTGGGIWYNSSSLQLFEGAFSDADCKSKLQNNDVQEFYIKTSSGTWNTDATGTLTGSEKSTLSSESTDRNGNHKEITTDLSLLEGVLVSAQGHTMCQNYGTGLEQGTTPERYTKTEDHCKPVLISVLTGQELHTKPLTKSEAAAQKPYDSHNFIEFVYSEPVDINSLKAGEKILNIQGTKTLGSVENIQTGGVSVSGFATISVGELTTGTKSSENGIWSGKIDTFLPHALYRTFSLSSAENDKNQTNRLRLSAAGYVDAENPVVHDGISYNNYTGYIESSKTPEGIAHPLANSLIVDLATDNAGTRLNNVLDSAGDENHALKLIRINADAAGDLYGSWDCSHPTFTPYITELKGSGTQCWSTGDSPTREYEMVGTVDSISNAYIEKIELHIFDDTYKYSPSDDVKWLSKNGWVKGPDFSEILENHEAPESTGGSRGFREDSAKTYGGIRRSSLEGALASFRYSYKLDKNSSSQREFEKLPVSQNVKSALFREETKTITETYNDGLYLSLPLNKADVSKLPIRTVFTVTFRPGASESPVSFITDLAGNRLRQTDVDSDTKILNTIDISPPAFTMTLAPIGEDKIYTVFSKPLFYNSINLSQMSGSEREDILEKIANNLEFVYSASDDIDNSDYPAGDDAINITKAEYVSSSEDYSALLFTINAGRKISLNDVEKLWLRINGNGIPGVNIFGQENVSSYIQDKYGNGMSYHTCHAISDFALNAANVIYARAESMNDDNWDEKGIYGTGIFKNNDDYAVHDFTGNGGNYSRVKTESDITLQVQFVGGKNDQGYFAPVNGEKLKLIPDKKSDLNPAWIADKYNMQTGSSWRVWLTSPLDSLSSSYNDSPLPSPECVNVQKSDLLKNFTLKNEIFEFANKEEYQFIFKILDSDGNDITINHDGDKTTEKVPLYSLWMPDNYIRFGIFSYVNLWSFSTSDIQKQRGGVTILNNVIDVSIREQTVIEVDMKEAGDLNVFVMTLDGNIVKRLTKGRTAKGTHYYRWDGTNNSGSAVARGLYFVRVVGPEIDETRKVMCVK